MTGPGNAAHRLWTPAEIRLAQLRRTEGKAFKAIDTELGRSKGSTYQKLVLGLRRTPGRRALPKDAAAQFSRPAPVTGCDGRVPELKEDQLAARDRLQAARYRQYETDITATFFGDPPRGYSALDRRKPKV